MPKPHYTIEVEQEERLPEAVFKVKVKGGSTTQHTVYVDKEYYDKVGDGQASTKDLVKRSFEFLLQREPNTAILGEFSLRDIQKYFPEYEDSIKE